MSGRRRIMDYDKVYAMRDAGVSAIEIAKFYNVNRSSVYLVLKLRTNFPVEGEETRFMEGGTDGIGEILPLGQEPRNK